MKKFKWVVEFTVDETWVADGFNLNDDYASEMIQNALPYAYSNETSAKIISSPDKASILKAQGYTAKDIREQRLLD